MMLGDADRLITEAAEGTRYLTINELSGILAHVARRGFDPDARERARGSLGGLAWKGRMLEGRDWLTPLERHYLRHVIQQEQWPDGTTPDGYVETVRQIIEDPASGVFASRYQGSWQLGVIRLSGELRGPGGSEWVLLEYRVATRHWVTAYQPADGLAELDNPRRGDVRWLRQPRPTGESR